MGGKTAMNFAAKHPQMLDKLVVIDIAPRYYPPHHQKVVAALQAVVLSDLNHKNDADEVMKNYGLDEGTRQFLLKNLYKNDLNGFEWRFNLSSLAKNIERVGEELKMEIPFKKPTLFIRGGNSNYILDADRASILSIFPDAQIKTVADAGHWVHAEKPQELLKLLTDFLD